MTRLKTYLLLLPFAFILYTCDTNEPPQEDNTNKPTITISVEDVSPTEVWLNVETKNLQLPNELLLLRNGDTSNVFSLLRSDTLIYQDSLLPSQTYTYQISSIRDQVSSNEVNSTTMDTTSHNFSWEVFEFGEHGNSILRDVAIIDENNIWAVGEIYLKDSTGANDHHAYNAIRWNGSEWETKRIRYHGDCSAVVFPPLYSILAFSNSEIVLTNGGSIGWFDGDEIELDCGVQPLLDGAINEMWGSSTNDIYVVGNKGTIAHYNGTSWSKIESGTNVDLKDVWGDDNGNVWSVGWEDFKPTQLLRIKENTATIIYSENTPLEYPAPNQFSGRLGSVWTKNSKKQFIMTSYGVYEMSNGSVEQVKLKYDVGRGYYGYSRKLRGSELNNMFIGGDNGLIWHFNGISWQLNNELYNIDLFSSSIDVKNNVVVMVGEKFNSIFTFQGVIIIGKK